MIPYMIRRLASAGVSTIPVIGYDRWGNVDYRLGLGSIPARADGHFCLRLDSIALEDTTEPEHFRETISNIVEELGLDPRTCSILLDFGDISMDSMSLESLVSTASSAIEQLQGFGFGLNAVAGCSLPNSINLAVGGQNSEGVVLRKEKLLWQTLRLEYPSVKIVSGDYGVRGPTTTEIRTKYMNGKIRHTIKNQTFIVRGHPFISDGGGHEQMYELAAKLVNSQHYLGAGFSWGDGEIDLCRRRQFLGSSSDWIAVDTNHHLAFVVQEVEEFERGVVRAIARERA